KTLQPKTMEGISGFGHFEFEERTVRVWKMYGIGQGRLFENLSGFTTIKKGVNPEMFWTGYLTSKGKADEEPDDVDEIDEHGDETQGGSVHEGNFTCNECGVAFIKYGNLLRHLDIGKHKIRPEKITLHDCALQ
ncbi:hypothetical protein PENTCL1PPCAC_14506, partial [Pristionchus entomophagus]